MVTVSTIYDRLEILVPDSAGTLAGFRAWAKSGAFPDRGQIAFIDQEILVDISPERIESHAAVKAEVYRVIGNLIRQLDLGQFYPDGTLLTNVEAELSTVPDGTFVAWESFETRRVRLESAEAEHDALELEGSPDWVLEVVSNSSVRKDTQILRKAYHRAGVREYWLIDARGEQLSFVILKRVSRGYAAVRPVRGWQASQVFGRQFRLDRSRGRAGLWKYTLHLRTP